MSERIPQRQEIAAENKWSIEDIYATDELWERTTRTPALQSIRIW